MATQRAEPRDPRPEQAGTRPRPGGAHHDPEIERLRKLSRWLDDRYVDPIVGLIVPGGGDMLSSVVGLYAVYVANKRGLPAATKARILVNLALDALIGSIPLIGDLFDLGFKANKRNLALIERSPTRRGEHGDKAFIAVAVVLFLVALTLPILGLVWLIQAIF